MPILTNQMESADQFYDELLTAHRHLSDRQSAEFNARLVFLLANQVGVQKTLSKCIELASE